MLVVSHLVVPWGWVLVLLSFSFPRSLLLPVMTSVWLLDFSRVSFEANQGWACPPDEQCGSLDFIHGGTHTVCLNIEPCPLSAYQPLWSLPPEEGVGFLSELLAHSLLLPALSCCKLATKFFKMDLGRIFEI